jgi:hypothetical protein
MDQGRPVEVPSQFVGRHFEQSGGKMIQDFDLHSVGTSLRFGARCDLQ